MSRLRDIRRKARTHLHNHMKVRALYVLRDFAPIPIFCRVHREYGANAIEGGARSGIGSLVDRQEARPSLVFMLSELEAAGIRPVRNAIVSVERGEAYRLDNAEAQHNITVRWFVTVITDRTELESLPIPEDE